MNTGLWVARRGPWVLRFLEEMFTRPRCAQWAKSFAWEQDCVKALCQEASTSWLGEFVAHTSLISADRFLRPAILLKECPFQMYRQLDCERLNNTELMMVHFQPHKLNVDMLPDIITRYIEEGHLRGLY